MSTYIVDDTKTMLMMNQDRWHETLKYIHDFEKE